MPQARSRFFIIARLEADAPELPVPTGEGRVCVEEALHDLPTLENGASVDLLPYRGEARSAYARLMRGELSECTGHLVSRNSDYVVERYPAIPPGGNWSDIPAEMMANYKDRSRCHTGSGTGT